MSRFIGFRASYLRLMTAGRHPKLEQQILKNSTGRQLEIAFVRAPPEDFEKLIRLTNFGEFDDGSHRKEKTQSVLDDPPSDDEPPLRFSLHSEIRREEKEKEKVARPVASVQPIVVPAPTLPIVAEGSAAVRQTRAKAAILIGMAYDSVANSLGRSARCRRQTRLCNAYEVTRATYYLDSSPSVLD